MSNSEHQVKAELQVRDEKIKAEEDLSLTDKVVAEIEEFCDRTRASSNPKSNKEVS